MVFLKSMSFLFLFYSMKTEGAEGGRFGVPHSKVQSLTGFFWYRLAMGERL